MTNPDYTHLLLVVDRSGSMARIAGDMNGGIRSLLHDQAQEPGQLLIDAWVFDDRIVKVTDNSEWSDPLLFNLVSPRGSTSLHDAVGSAVTDLGAHLAALPEDRRPGKVVVVIVTDGYENSSQEWTADTVKVLVTQQREQYGWTFLFLGANQDAVLAGSGMGIPAANSVTYAANAAATANTWASTSGVLRSARSGLAAAYSEDDRVAAVVSGS